MKLYSFVESPLGALLVRRDDVGLTHLYLPSGRHSTTPPDDAGRDDAAFADVRTQLDEYFAGNRTEFDLPLHPTGTPFQQRVWTELARIPHGATRTYGDIAGHIDAPGSARAVGLANGQNPISIVVPCHRVIGANGSLTGYGGGLAAKQWLLGHEAQRDMLFR